MKEKASDLQRYCRERGILINVCHGNTVRLIPPLIMGKAEADIFIDAFNEFLN